MRANATEARKRIEELLRGQEGSEALADAWRELDEAMSSGGRLPLTWERYTSGPAAEYVGCTQRVWATAVSKGYAPAPDGYDTSSRAVWSEASLNKVKGPDGPRWLPRVREHPPLSGTGASTPAWRAWARSQGLEIGPYEERNTIITRARMAGLLPTA